MRFVLVLLFMFILMATGWSQPDSEKINGGQMIIVVTDNPVTVRATLYAYEKIMGQWNLQFSCPAVVGKNGLAEPNTTRFARTKKEGDDKSPAGIFYLGPAFGYAESHKLEGIHFPYVQSTDTLICVDDDHSRYYNQLVRTDTANKDWRSHEDMRRGDNAYLWGLFIQYNTLPVTKGNGSCIFLHIWENEHEGTAGCTAIDKDNMLRLLHWIRAEKKPVLIQYAKNDYSRVRKKLLLPEL